ncbi:MAG: tRNA (adenosine(37)-N6)-dimethylallyltransferase MiaA [Endomicrobium sp.]|jgi:tRNA dimethylallyltransferase|nr:tRNA (adenosine(37)-N6)-dimethylallyltransferase MiaA [Endomicrobium sp.]
MNKIIIISGPTASGKTARAIEFCKKNNGEIISCDSRQIYKYLDIGTNKEGIFIHDGLRKVAGISQYLTDIVDPDKIYSAIKFTRDSDVKISEIFKRGKIPVITGGTGLYIKTLIYGFDEMPEANEVLRKEFMLQSQEQLYNRLLKLDPESAKRNKLNPQRLIRALEINILSGKTIGEHFKSKKLRYNFDHYSISVSNKILYEKIDKRCKYMIENGMIEETQKVLSMGFDRKCPALSGIGYKQIVQYLDNKISKNTLVLEFSKNTRHYAKRQITWFKSQPEVKFI